MCVEIQQVVEVAAARLAGKVYKSFHACFWSLKRDYNAICYRLSVGDDDLKA